jgi:cell division protein FtsB
MDIRIADGARLIADGREWLFRWRRRVATVGVCLLAALLGFNVVYGQNGWLVYSKKKVEYRQLQQELKDLQKENEDLEHRVKALQTDPKAIEKEAREQLRYAKPGEIVYVLPEQKPAPAAETGVAHKTAKP